MLRSQALRRHDIEQSSLDESEYLFYSSSTRFAGQVRNRCSRSTCPGWLPVIHTRRPTGSRNQSLTTPRKVLPSPVRERGWG